MAIVYNGTQLTNIKFGDTTLTAVYYCDTRAGTCTKVFPETTLSYSYCEFQLPTFYVCGSKSCSMYGTSYTWTICCGCVSSSICVDMHDICHSTTLIRSACCVDSSPTCCGSVDGYNYCISTESVWSSCVITTNAINCINDTVYNCSFSANTTVCPKYICTPLCVYTIICNKSFTGNCITWYNEVNSTLPTNTRYAVACITNTSSGVTCCICCPISNSAGSINFQFSF